MKIHEYQGKEILRQFGVPVPRGYPAFSVREATEAAQKLGGPVWVVKAQIHAGGRGKGGGVKGCTHITELTQVLPTAVVQAFAGDVIDTRGDTEASQQPFQIDRCHALRSDGLAVKTYYPRWYRTSGAPEGSATGRGAPTVSEN